MFDKDIHRSTTVEITKREDIKDAEGTSRPEVFIDTGMLYARFQIKLLECNVPLSLSLVQGCDTSRELPFWSNLIFVCCRFFDRGERH